jgi:hypothetical protein
MSESKGKPKSVEDVKKEFGEDVDEFLEFAEKDGIVVLTPKAWLGPSAFNDIIAIVRHVGGDYIKGDKAAGVKSHFEVPLEGKGSKPIKVAKDQARHILNTFRADVEALVSKTIKELEDLMK